MPDPCRFFLQHDSDAAETIRLPGVEIAAYSCRCPGKETSNEDAAVVIPVGEHSFVLAVADGVGGVRGGEQASKVALGLLTETVQQNCSDPALLRVSILDGIERANAAILETNLGACTTLAVVEFHAADARPYHVGDSMILISGQRGRIRYQTVSHSPVGFAVESGLLDETEAMHHEERHLVSNVVGDEHMRIEIGPFLKLARRDTVLLASDGLFDNLRIEEIVDVIRSGPLAPSVAKLVETARDRMINPTAGHPSKPDDLTILAFRQSADRKRKTRSSSSTFSQS